MQQLFSFFGGRGCPVVAGLALGLAGTAQAQQFAPLVTYATGPNGNPSGIVVADVNQDGHLDVVTVHSLGHAVGVLLNQGAGTFAPVATYATGSGSNPQGLAVGDVNQDGYPDIATANYRTNTVAILLNRRDGTFAPPVAYPVGAGSGPEDVVLSDLNRDGYLDLATANTTGSTSAVLLNRRDGTFAPFVAYAAGAPGSSPQQIAVGDLNADSYPDLVTANNNSQTAVVLLNQGTGTFAPFAAYAAGGAAFGVEVGDVDGDGYADVCTTNFNNTVGVLRNQRTGTLAPVVTYATGSGSGPLGVAIGDVNGDGYADLVTANSQGNAAGLLLGQPGSLFAAGATYATGARSYPVRVALADFNHDGHLDIATAHSDGQAVGILLSRPAGSPEPTSLSSLPIAEAGLYPNPALAGTLVTLQLTDLPTTASTLSVTMLDAVGRVVRQHQVNAAQGAAGGQLPTQGLAPGWYLLRLAAYDAQQNLVQQLPTQRLSLR